VSYAVRLLANAQRDIDDIEAYYDDQVPHETKRCLNAIEAALDWIAGHAHPPVVSSCVTSALKRSGITSGIACSRKNSTYRSSPSCIIVAGTMLLQSDFHEESAALA